MKMQKVLIVLLASLIAMLLCSGVTLAKSELNCCAPGSSVGDPCYCKHAGNEGACESEGGIWMPEGCSEVMANSYCVIAEDGKKTCTPEATTIALLATGLICMVGYLRLRRKEE